MLVTARYLLQLFCVPLLVSAALYPTYPVASTVLVAGRKAFLSWKDDGKYPNLNMMPTMSVQMFTRNDTYVATLSTAVDPRSQHCEVLIHPEWADRRSLFNIRFVTTYPYSIIYTADFKILEQAPSQSHLISSPSITAHADLSQSTIQQQTQQTGQDGLVTFQLLTLVLPNTTIVSQLSPSPVVLATVTTVTVSDDALPTPTSEKQQGGKNASPSRIDLARAKFRVIFVLWPALIGISMSL